MRVGYRLGVTMCAALAAATLAAPAGASAPHTVQPGETLWSIAASNGLTSRTVAVFNGLPEDAQVAIGETIQVPTVDEGEAALIDAGITPGSTATAGADPSADTSSIVPAPGMGHITTPWGQMHLTPAAAESWEAMRQESLATFGVDLYPAGPVSAYRTFAQQADLYELFLGGQGAPAYPPGQSSHETGTAVDVETPEMRDVIDQIGGAYGWAKVEAPDEWWHVNYVGG
jgi:LysM repeat protein